jgi:hypothetical protein
MRKCSTNALHRRIRIPAATGPQQCNREQKVGNIQLTTINVHLINPIKLRIVITASPGGRGVRL